MRKQYHFGDCNGIRTHYHLVRKRALKDLAKLARYVKLNNKSIHKRTMRITYRYEKVAIKELH